MKNNLFSFATKELSQDAFICWLCSFAKDDIECEEDALRKCAKHLLCEFIGGDDSSDIKLLEAKKQVMNIDVLLLVEYLNKKYYIIVEDKVHTSEHDDQLNRYKESLKSICTYEEIVCVYFKTGFQSDYSAVKDANYRIIDRRLMLDIFRCYEGDIHNNIFRDFYTYWFNYNIAVNSYNSIGLNDWDDQRQVNGFFEYMQTEISELNDCWAGYGWVNNRGGCFWGFWYGYNDDVLSYNNATVALYLQLEIKWNYKTNKYDWNLCLKFEKKEGDDENIKKIKDKILDEIVSCGFIKADRIRSADHMTLGKYDMDCSTSSELKDIMIEALNDGLKTLIAIFNLKKK